MVGLSKSLGGGIKSKNLPGFSKTLGGLGGRSEVQGLPSASWPCKGLRDLGKGREFMAFLLPLALLMVAGRIALWSEV